MDECETIAIAYAKEYTEEQKHKWIYPNCKLPTYQSEVLFIYKGIVINGYYDILVGDGNFLNSYGISVHYIEIDAYMEIEELRQLFIKEIDGESTKQKQ